MTTEDARGGLLAVPDHDDGATVNATGIAAGWYPDPAMSGLIRFWDGFGWTEHLAAPLGHQQGTVAVEPGRPLSLPASALASRPPKAPKRPLPLPAKFVLGTVLIGFPVAVLIGVVAAHASAPAPLAPWPAAVTKEQADDNAKKDLAHIAAALTDFYSDPANATATMPNVTMGVGTYGIAPPPVRGGGSGWSWPDIVATGPVTYVGLGETATGEWCIYIQTAGGTVDYWHATADGISAGSCNGS